jgi:hypothetical protein
MFIIALLSWTVWECKVSGTLTQLTQAEKAIGLCSLSLLPADPGGSFHAQGFHEQAGHLLLLFQPAAYVGGSAPS